MGVKIVREEMPSDLAHQTRDRIMSDLNHERGAFMCSDYIYPNRYEKWEIGFTHPQLVLRASGRSFEIESLQMDATQSRDLLNFLADEIMGLTHLKHLEMNGTILFGEMDLPCCDQMTEEERRKQSSIFDVIRLLQKVFQYNDAHFGLYGSFGYDLLLQFETIDIKQTRDNQYPDLVLYLPRILYVKEEGSEQACVYEYHIDVTSRPINKTMDYDCLQIHTRESRIECQHIKSHAKKVYARGMYANQVSQAIPYFKRGDLFEVVPSYERYFNTDELPSKIFERLRTINPSPYAFFINLGGEHLVGTSPEMYVRVTNGRVETCPISGTIDRGKDALSDSEQILKLLTSTKDESELTMCTDVDRNDKSKVCHPESIRVIGRRQIEMYSHLIHTVDHVEGQLEPESDGIDAFIAHMWAVTVTGAPKKAAIQFIEEREDTPRKWYGGAVGKIGMNGDVHTGLTLRTLHIKQKEVAIRVGATLLYDSNPESEEQETITKAKALEKALFQPYNILKSTHSSIGIVSHKPVNVLLVDHEDSFVHTLAAYFKASGCKVTTIRQPLLETYLHRELPGLVILSPGPGNPEQFKLSQSIHLCVTHKIPVFGVCLGLQGIIEYFGGQLAQLETPVHGKRSSMHLTPMGISSHLFSEMPSEMAVGRYHSLYASYVPCNIRTTAETDDGIPMAIEHETLPIYAVQFHPESIMTAQDELGRRLIENMVKIARNNLHAHAYDQTNVKRIPNEKGVPNETQLQSEKK